MWLYVPPSPCSQAGGGLDLGVHLACPEARVVCHVEREAFAAAVLVARMESGDLAPSPVWSDVSTFDGVPWRGLVDLVAGGFPCQDISNAGKRAGITGERSGLWSHYARILAEVRPPLVFVENVSALVGRGLGVVLGDLAALGYDAEWGCFRASDVGAPHRRERLFLLAHADCGASALQDSRRSSGRPDADDRGTPMGDPHDRPRDVRPEPRGDLRDPPRTGEQVGDADGEGLEGRRVTERRGGDEWTPWAPGPEERDRWREFLRLSPDLEPAVCGGAHGVAGGLEYRADRLRLLGNGVVPPLAAVALLELAARAGIRLS